MNYFRLIYTKLLENPALFFGALGKIAGKFWEKIENLW